FVDAKKLELPKNNQPFEEVVTIDSLTKDKLVLSGGDTWKFAKTEFARPAAVAVTFDKNKIVGTWEIVRTNGFVEFGDKGATVTFTKDGQLMKSGQKDKITYKIEEDKLVTTQKTPDGLELGGSNAIKTLTDDTLVLKVGDGADTIDFKRKK